MAETRNRRGISRRGLLIGGGAAVGLLVAWQVWPRSYAPNLRVGEGEHLFNAFLKIGVDGRVIVAIPQTEIGQGVYTSLPQILADELGADWATVAVESAPLSPLYANHLYAEELAGNPLPSPLDGVGRWALREHVTRNAVMLTGGSTSVRSFEPRLREAGAAARALLLMAAAERWGADWRELDTQGGFAVRGEDRIAFGDLAEAAAEFEPPDELPMREGPDNRLAGQPLPRIDTPSKVDGSARFAGDIRLPDMLFAAVRSAPPGATFAELDEAAGAAIPGALKLFRNPRWIGVAGTTWWAAARALEELRPTFTRPEGAATVASVERALAEGLGSVGSRIVHSGDVETELAANDVIRATYSVGLAPNAPLETLTATARVVGDLMEVWAPAQAPGLARAAAARASGFAESRITLHPTLVGSGYGRKFETLAIEQAVTMAVSLGRPVQLVWPRIEEIRADFPRPAARADMAARFGNGGTLSAWQARIAVPETTGQLLGRLDAGFLLSADAGADVAGATPPYSIPGVSIERVPAGIGVETGYWRSGAHSYTCFFTESFVDELARRADIEPLSFRMQILGGNPRLARVLAEATAIGGWDGGPPGSGIGIACHSAFGSYIALLVEIEITADQRIRVLRAVAAVDCGRVVNPDIVKQQIEGGIVHGVSGATGAPLALEHGAPAATTIAELGLPILADAPDVTVEIIPSEDAPGGVTELGVPPVAPAVANALFSLTGRRIRSLPLQAGRPA
jgi:isoquinoline 1-oxidoreductase beta subunit